MSAYDQLIDRYRTITSLQGAQGLMQWDRQVMMPAGGSEVRTEQSTRLALLEHQLWTDDRMARLVEDASKETDPDTVEGANVRVARREWQQVTSLPAELVERKSRVGGAGYEAWKRAKAEADFSILEPALTELFAIAGEVSALRNPNAEHPYDPLIDMFDEGNTYALAKAQLDAIKGPVMALLQEIAECGRPVDDAALTGVQDQEALRRFAAAAAAKIGFDFNRGRLDQCANAFCAGQSRFDVRMTTRASDHVKGIVSSSLHEMGHGLYQQGDDPSFTGLPISGGASLAIHESQSRLWENIVGRSSAFWSYFYPSLQAEYAPLRSVGMDQFWRGMNKVEPTFIRVGADELSYNLHIIIRFELEVEILTGVVQVKDLPEAWNAKYAAYLGITPPNAALGCLQDVHWSRGSVGYFPTYALGNIIGGAVWKQLKHELGDVAHGMASGNFAPLLDWLTEKIYALGQRYRPQEILSRMLPSQPDGTEWLDYAIPKYRELYELG